MEPAFIYFDDLTFNDKKFTLKFSQEKETKNFFLKKTKILLLLALHIL